jgi:hypothetical protein
MRTVARSRRLRGIAAEVVSRKRRAHAPLFVPLRCTA